MELKINDLVRFKLEGEIRTGVVVSDSSYIYAEPVRIKMTDTYSEEGCTISPDKDIEVIGHVEWMPLKEAKTAAVKALSEVLEYTEEYAQIVKLLSGLPGFVLSLADSDTQDCLAVVPVLPKEFWELKGEISLKYGKKFTVYRDPVKDRLVLVDQATNEYVQVDDSDDLYEYFNRAE